MTLSITTRASPSEADREDILERLRAYNDSRSADPRVSTVALMLSDKQGDRVGGLWGKCAYDWLFVELLFVPEAHRCRHYGRALLQRAESIARTNECVGIWLDTFEFQACGFYERVGFNVFGTLEDHPIGRRRFFLSKRL